MTTPCVWYWSGGSVAGAWHYASAGTRKGILRSGCAAVDGTLEIGPPEGPPRPALRREVNAACGASIFNT